MNFTEEPDAGDLDALEELERSRGWALVKERIKSELDRAGRELEGDFGPEKTNKQRGYIAALRMVLSLPGIRKAEISDTLKETTKDE